MLRSNFKSYSILLIVCILLFGYCPLSYALNLDKVKINFLGANYPAAIKEGEKLLAQGNTGSENMDELYYLLGLSYLESGNYLRASDIFEIILKEFKFSLFKDEARIGLGDSYFKKGDLDRARAQYLLVSDLGKGGKFQAAVYYRLSQLEFKKGNTSEGKDYADKLKSGFSSSLEARINQELCPVINTNSGVEVYYTVQVGSFSRSANADSLVRKLVNKGYPAYSELNSSGSKPLYRVRIGKFARRLDAVTLEKKLSQEGYPTKVYP